MVIVMYWLLVYFLLKWELPVFSPWWHCDAAWGMQDWVPILAPILCPSVLLLWGVGVPSQTSQTLQMTQKFSEVPFGHPFIQTWGSLVCRFQPGGKSLKREGVGFPRVAWAAVVLSLLFLFCFLISTLHSLFILHSTSLIVCSWTMLLRLLLYLFP